MHIQNQNWQNGQSQDQNWQSQQNQSQYNNAGLNRQHLSGVRCVVSNCSYHVQGDHCSASSIDIQPKNASQSQETDCATFQAK